MKTIFLTLTAVTFILSFQFDVIACNVPPPPSNMTFEQVVNSAKDNSAAIFTGKVTDIINAPQFDYAIVKFRVKHFWKGDVPEEISITTRNYEGGCGYEFEIGKTYLVYANNYRVNDANVSNLRTDIYRRTNELSSATKDFKILGKGKKPQKAKS